MERYEESRERIKFASPPLPDDAPSVTMRGTNSANSETRSNRLSVKAAKEVAMAEQKRLEEEARMAKEAEAALTIK